LSRRALLVGATAIGAAAIPGSAAFANSRQSPHRPRQVTPDELAQSGPGQFRWLTVPNSRLVLNPYDFNQTTSEVVQNSGPDVPLSAGCYAGDQATTIPKLLAVFRHPGGTPDPQPPDTVFADDFDDLDPAWTTETGLTAQVADSQLTLELTADSPNPWGALSHQLTVDVDAFPVVAITVVGVDGQWALKVNDGTQTVDTVLQGDTGQTGALTYDLRSATGWSGVKTFDLRLFAIGRQAPLVVDRIAVQSEPVSWLEEAAAHATTWRPYALDFTARYASGGSLSGYDVFHDHSSFTRVLAGRDLEQGDAGAGLTLAGRFNGAVAYGAGLLVVSTETFRYAVAVGRDVHVRYYANDVDLRAGGPTLDKPGPTGWWAVQLPADDATIGVGFGYPGETDQDARHRAIAAARHHAGPVSRARWRRYWSSVLARVPHPDDFSLPAVPTFDLSDDQVRADYYRAWVFLQSDVLPPEPEIGYPYPQLAAGKPSMWNNGAEGARASASWDSLLGMQYLVYLDPTSAWRSFEGLMSLVDDDGRLGGESLPSRKAQTAWTLYSVTGDRRRLARIYPNLRRYLLWAQRNPRWIFGDHDFPDERDAEFVVSVHIDQGYARRIAAEIGADADLSLWDNHRAQLRQQYSSWFFPDSGPAKTLQYHYVDGSHADSAGNTLWVTTGLHLDGLTARHRDLLLERFEATFDPSEMLAGWGFPDVKAPDVTFTCYGLLDVGRAVSADQFAQAVLGGIVASGEYAEVYDNPDSGPVGTGVRPSLFGAVNVIDFVWLRNGYRADQGMPVFVNLPATAGGISGLSTNGRRFDLSADAGTKRVCVYGPAIKGHRAVLEVAVGQSTPLPARLRR